MRRKLLLIFIFFVVVSLPLAALAQESDSKPGMIWGTNYYVEFWRPDEVATLSQMPLKMVRWGGNESDNSLTNADMALLFANLMHKQNIEPLFQVSLFRLKPEQAAALVKHVNIDNPGNMKYWTVGNEPEYFKSSHNNDITPEEYVKKWRELVVAMKAADPSIKIVGPDVSLHMTPIDERAFGWFDAAIKANGDLMDVISFHFYPFYLDPVSRETILTNPDDYLKGLTQLRTYLRDTLKRDVPIMLTEVNLNSNPGVGTDSGGNSLFAGVWLADICGISAREGLMGVLAWTATRGGNLALIDNMQAPHPTFYAMQAYAGYNQPIADAKASVDGVKAYAGTTDKGFLVVLINRNDKAVTLKLDSDVSLGSDHKLDASSVTLGAYSFTRLHFDAQGKFIDGTSYGQTENETKSAPSAVKLS
jgi:hypothetical protein